MRVSLWERPAQRVALMSPEKKKRGRDVCKKGESTNSLSRLVQTFLLSLREKKKETSTTRNILHIRLFEKC